MTRMMASIMPYKEQLKDPRWIEFRKKVYRKDGYKCSICGSRNRPLNAHHKYYTKNKKAWEYLVEDMTTLCNWCHSSLHGFFYD